MIRYTVTAIKKDGSRQLAFDNNSRHTYETEQEARQRMNDVIKNNAPETVADLVGKDLEVTAVDCYEGGDSKRTYFDTPKTAQP